MQDPSIFKRKETTFEGGETVCNTYLASQTVTIEGLHRVPGHDAEEEDMWRIRDANGNRYVVDGCDLNPHPEAPLLNTEFMALVMTWCKTPLMHAFILQALDQYARAVVKADVATLETPFIAGAAWQETARDYLGFCAARD
jgi:hypothetical protein